MPTIDFKQEYKPFYSPRPGQPEIITMPIMQFAVVDGRGDPEVAAAFHDAISALYGVAYTLKFSRKKSGEGTQFTLGPLEGLWSAPDGKWDASHKNDWEWRLMLWVPDDVTKEEFEACIAELQRRKPNPALAALRLEPFMEGRVVQVMHVGPYGEEQENIERMETFATQAGYVETGKHHEIYLGDPRRTAPERLRTILRHPVRPRS